MFLTEFSGVIATMRADYQLAEARENYTAKIKRIHYCDNICDITSVIYVNPSEVIGKNSIRQNVIWL